MSYTVFDVARGLLRRTPQRAMSTVKLQKLCFYSFGWYAHQTASSLFPEPFYAMEKGPVVGDLLTLHSRKSQITESELALEIDRRGSSSVKSDPYFDEIIDAIWKYYGRYTPWELVDLTHLESVWSDAWRTRASDSKRANMPHRHVVSYFLSPEVEPPEGLSLPDAKASVENSDWIRKLEETSTRAPYGFAADVARLLIASR